MTKLEVTNNLERGIDIRINVPHDELFDMTADQVHMLHILDTEPIIEQLQLLLTILLEINSRGATNGKS